jgi:hypothetical protein
MVTLCACGLMAGGCLSGDDIEDILDELDDLELSLIDEVGVIQDEDPTVVILPDDSPEVIIDNDATVIIDPSEQLIVEELPDITLLGFDNLTGFDTFITYAVDGQVQGVFVFDGEALLIEYPCLFDVELIAEDHFDIFTGELVESFEYQGLFFEEGLDFFCGEAFIFTFDPEGVFAGAETIPL